VLNFNTVEVVTGKGADAAEELKPSLSPVVD
jgi:hypothetical protein